MSDLPPIREEFEYITQLRKDWLRSVAAFINRWQDVYGDEVYIATGGATGAAPAYHAETHEAGGVDPVKLDDLKAPDDNTDLDATTLKHGLLPKLAGGAASFLRADGTWSVPSGGAGTEFNPPPDVGDIAVAADTGGDEVIPKTLAEILDDAHHYSASSSTTDKLYEHSGTQVWPKLLQKHHSGQYTGNDWIFDDLFTDAVAIGETVLLAVRGVSINGSNTRAELVPITDGAAAAGDMFWYNGTEWKKINGFDALKDGVLWWDKDAAKWKFLDTAAASQYQVLQLDANKHPAWDWLRAH